MGGFLLRLNSARMDVEVQRRDLVKKRAQRSVTQIWSSRESLSRAASRMDPSHEPSASVGSEFFGLNRQHQI